MDIVERLKQEFSGNALKDIADQTRAYVKERHEAADEIERLREALKTFADNVKETNVGIDKNWAETVYPLKAENQRLREKVKEWDQIAYVIDSHGITHEEFTIIFKDEE